MSSMEPEIRAFLKKVLFSVFFGLFWLMINMTVGIYFGLLFMPEGLQLANILFYLFAAFTLWLLVRYYMRTWKNKKPPT